MKHKPKQTKKNTSNFYYFKILRQIKTKPRFLDLSIENSKYGMDDRERNLISSYTAG